VEVLIYLVPLALGLGLLGLAAFLWALKSGQYDDLDGAAWRAISDDDEPPKTTQTTAGSIKPRAQG
jgi:cbb3-type cytochrome oxidase maturation protein